MDPNLCNATSEFLYKICSKFLYIKKKRKKEEAWESSDLQGVEIKLVVGSGGIDYYLVCVWKRMRN